MKKMIVAMVALLASVSAFAQEAAPAAPELIPPVEKESEVHTEATSSIQIS